MEDEKLRSLAKNLRIALVVLGLALLVIGVLRYFAYGDYVGFGEDGILGATIFAISFFCHGALNKLAAIKEKEEEEEHDQGL